MSALRLARGFTGRRPDRQVRRLLPRPRRLAARQGGLRRAHLRQPELGRRARRHRGAHPGARLQRRFPGAERSSSERGSEIAGVIVEPVAGNMNLVLPAPGFLEALREECTRHGAVLILDEVMTGFRVAPGGAQARYGIRPDLTTLGKVIGGGLPVGAFGGRRDIMEKIAPLGPVYQAGTLSGNPVAVAAGLATLKLVASDRVPREARSNDPAARRRSCRRGTKAGVTFSAQSIGSMFGVYFRAYAADELRRGDAVRPRALQPLLPRRCSSAACTSRPRRTRRASCRRRTARPRSTRRSPRRERPSRKFDRHPGSRAFDVLDRPALERHLARARRR